MLGMKGSQWHRDIIAMLEVGFIYWDRESYEVWNSLWFLQNGERIVGNAKETQHTLIYRSNLHSNTVRIYIFLLVFMVDDFLN